MKTKATLVCAAATALLALWAGCARERFEARPLAPEQTRQAFEARTLDRPALKTFLEQHLGRPLSDWPLRQWDLPALVLAAWHYHPSLEVARAQWGVAQAGLVTAGARPNPSVGVVAGFNSSTPAGGTPWFPGLNWDVPIETAGKRGRRVAQAGHWSTAAQWRLAALAWQVRGGVRTSLLELAAAQHRQARLEQQLAVQQKIQRSLEQRLAAGALTAAELAPLLTQMAKTRVDLGEARRQYAEAVPRLAEALGVPARAMEGVALDLGWAAGTNAVAQFQSADIRALALRSRPDLLAALAEYAATQAALELEIARQYPDVRLGPGYEWDQGEHKWSLGFNLELPVFNRNQGPIAEAKAKRLEAEARFIALQAGVLSGMDSALAAGRAAQEQLAAYDALRAAQERQRQHLQALLDAGATDRAELLNLELEAALTETARLEARLKVEQALAQLEAAFQLPANPSPAAPP